MNDSMTVKTNIDNKTDLEPSEKNKHPYILVYLCRVSDPKSSRKVKLSSVYSSTSGTQSVLSLPVISALQAFS